MPVMLTKGTSSINVYNVSDYTTMITRRISFPSMNLAE